MITPPFFFDPKFRNYPQMQRISRWPACFTEVPDIQRQAGDRIIPRKKVKGSKSFNGELWPKIPRITGQ